MMSEELLPCPFCGGNAKETLTHLPTGWMDGVDCSKCGISIGCFPPGEAFAAWNARASSTALAERDAVIERAIQEVYDDARKACREMADGAQHADFVSAEYIKGFEAGFRAADMAILCRANAVFRQTLADLDGVK